MLSNLLDLVDSVQKKVHISLKILFVHSLLADQARKVFSEKNRAILIKHQTYGRDLWADRPRAPIAYPSRITHITSPTPRYSATTVLVSRMKVVFNWFGASLILILASSKTKSISFRICAEQSREAMCCEMWRVIWWLACFHFSAHNTQFFWLNFFLSDSRVLAHIQSNPFYYQLISLPFLFTMLADLV